MAGVGPIIENALPSGGLDLSQRDRSRTSSFILPFVIVAAHLSLLKPHGRSDFTPSLLALVRPASTRVTLQASRLGLRRPGGQASEPASQMAWSQNPVEARRPRPLIDHYPHT